MQHQDSQPSVCAVMLTADRPEMALQAIRAWQAQTYRDKHLLIYDTGEDRLPADKAVYGMIKSVSENYHSLRVTYVRGEKATIGGMRNSAVAHMDDDICIHWDDDDWSHPNRIAEQVALLQLTGADCVGYNEMLFWRETPQSVKDGYAEVLRRYPVDPNVPIPEHLQLRPGEAWQYRNQDPSYALGTSLCYWRRAWEAHPFEATSKGEDWRFTSAVKTVGVTSIDTSAAQFNPFPRMVARIHSSNTSNYDPREMERAVEWSRVPKWDQYCSGVFSCTGAL